MSFWNKVKEAAEKAKEAASQIEFKEAFDNVREATANQAAKAKDWSDSKYQQYYPTIEQAVMRSFVGFSESKLKDDDFIESCFNKAFELLPTPVRLVLPRNVFFDFCHKHKEKLISKAMQYRENNFAALENEKVLNIEAESIEQSKVDDS